MLCLLARIHGVDRAELGVLQELFSGLQVCVQTFTIAGLPIGGLGATRSRRSQSGKTVVAGGLPGAAWRVPVIEILVQIFGYAVGVVAVVYYVLYVRQIDRVIAESRRHTDMVRRRNDLADARWQKLMQQGRRPNDLADAMAAKKAKGPMS